MLLGVSMSESRPALRPALACERKVAGVATTRANALDVESAGDDRAGDESAGDESAGDAIITMAPLTQSGGR